MALLFVCQQSFEKWIFQQIEPTILRCMQYIKGKIFQFKWSISSIFTKMNWNGAWWHFNKAFGWDHLEETVLILALRFFPAQRSSLTPTLFPSALMYSRQVYVRSNVNLWRSLKQAAAQLESRPFFRLSVRHTVLLPSLRHPSLNYESHVKS